MNVNKECTFIGLVIFTVAMALPAYIGRWKVSEFSTAITSVRGDESNRAAALGMKFFPLFDEGARTCEYVLAIWTIKFDKSSAAKWEYADPSATKTLVTFCTLAACCAACCTS